MPEGTRRRGPGEVNLAGPGAGDELVPAGFRLRPDPGSPRAGGRDGDHRRLSRPGAAAQPGRGTARGGLVVGNARARRRRRPGRWPGGCSTPASRIPRSADVPGAPGPDEVTVVIPVRDRAAELARCLAGLTGTGPAGAARVIVVDDGSRDPSAVRAGGGRGRCPGGVAPGQRRARGGQEHRAGGGADAAGGVPRLGLRARPRLAGRAAAALRRPRGGRGRAAHRAARGRAHLAGAVRGGEFHPGHGPAAQHRPARIARPLRPGCRPGRPPGRRRGGFRRGHAGRRGRRLRLAARRRGLAGALRARGRHGPPAPGAAAPVVLPAEGLRDIGGRARAAAPRHGPPALRVGVDRGGLAGRGARPSGGRRRRSPGPVPPCSPAGWRRSPASRGPSRPARPRGGWRPGRRAAGRSRRPGRWAARSRGSGGRPRCRPRSRCGGCGSRWPRWSSRRRCSTGWTAGRRSIRCGTWRPGCSTTPRTASESGKDVPNEGPSSPCCPCCAAAARAAGPYPSRALCPAICALPICAGPG